MVDKLLDDAVVRHFHHGRNASEALAIDLLWERRIVIRIDASGVGIKIFLGVPLIEQGIGIERHTLWQFNDFLASASVVIDGNFVDVLRRSRRAESTGSQCEQKYFNAFH